MTQNSLRVNFNIRNNKLLCSLPNIYHLLYKSGQFYSSESLKFVPKHSPVEKRHIEQLREFISTSSALVILTGAGISTESGIPDYRSEEVGLYARKNHKPIQHQEFIKYPNIQQRYWARNYVGWEIFSERQPNVNHYCIRNLEIDHKVHTVVTQNVDSLHYKAGSKKVIELHGTAFQVVCLQCQNTYSRYEIQEKLKIENPGMPNTISMIRPDGDVDIPEEAISKFKPPMCEFCGGILKPDITFFGDNVPLKRVQHVRDSVSASDGLLILGSSLSVFSSYRIVLQAVEENKKIGIINIGPTRGDKLVNFKISAKCGDILPKIC